MAEKKLDALLEYLLETWSQKVKKEFVKKLDRSIIIIQASPEIFPQSKKQKGLHKCVVTKQTTIFYRFYSERINILTVFDTRQNPKQLNKEI